MALWFPFVCAADEKKLRDNSSGSSEDLQTALESSMLDGLSSCLGGNGGIV